MSYWSTFIGIVQKFCEEDTEIEELLKQTDQLQRDNVLLENALEDQEREHTRLQIELFNVETMMGPVNQQPKERSTEETNVQIMESCTNIRYAVSQIDFMKILQCNHMQMEQNWRKEWQQMQEYSVAILKWHDKMEQRDVVQRYRKIEMTYKEAKSNLERNERSMEKTLQESFARLGRAKEKRNGLIICLVESTRDLKNMREEYQMLQEYGEKIASLRKKKLDLKQKLDEAESKNFSALMPFHKHTQENKSSPTTILQTFNNDLPKFPTFAEILRSFNQDAATKPDKRPEITVIENTTNIMVKSILRNSQDNSMEINQSITTKHTKQVRFKLQLEEQFEFTDYTDTTVSDTSSEDSQDTAIAVEQPKKTVEESEGTEIQAEIPTVDLLTPADNNEIEQNSSMDVSDRKIEAKENPSLTKPKVDILECVIIKPPLQHINDFPPEGKENIPPYVGSKKVEEKPTNTKQSDDAIMPPPTSPAVLKRRDNFSKTFYDELMKSSSSPNISSGSDTGTPTRHSLKDFNSYLNESKVESPKEQNEVHNRDNSSNCLNFMDFNSNNFIFDSNDENEDGGIMDFSLC